MTEGQLSNYQEKYPKAVAYFIDFLNENNVVFDEFKKLSFEFQLGVYLAFFNQIHADVQLYSIDSSVLIESIDEAFATYEEYLFLDS